MPVWGGAGRAGGRCGRPRLSGCGPGPGSRGCVARLRLRTESGSRLWGRQTVGQGVLLGCSQPNPPTAANKPFLVHPANDYLPFLLYAWTVLGQGVSSGENRQLHQALREGALSCGTQTTGNRRRTSSVISWCSEMRQSCWNAGCEGWGGAPNMESRERGFRAEGTVSANILSQKGGWRGCTRAIEGTLG